MKKIILIGVVSFLTFSCSTDSSSSATGEPVQDSTMTGIIDGNPYNLAPSTGGELSDPTGGAYGDTFQLLNGYVRIPAIARFPQPEKRINIRLLLPKTDLTVGTHFFLDTAEIGNYFADLDIVLGTDAGEDEDTVSGKITVTSYDSVTKRIKGTFEFTTDNGVSTSQTHAVTGSFNYVLID